MRSIGIDKSYTGKYNTRKEVIKYIVGHKIKDLTERVYTKREIEWLQNEILKIPSGEIFGFEKEKEVAKQSRVTRILYRFHRRFQQCGYQVLMSTA